MADMDRGRQDRGAQRPKVKASDLLYQLREDVRAMNSAISILSQKMRHLTRNEKILGRNLIVLNKKIKEMDEGSDSQQMSEELVKNFAGFEKEMGRVNKRIEQLNIVMASQSKKYVSSDELKELRYIIDSINPLELATLDQVKDIVKRELAARKKTQDPNLNL